MATRESNKRLETGKSLSDGDILKACQALKKKLHKQAKALIQRYTKNPYLCTTFDPESVLLDIDPLLMKCLEVLTTPGRSRGISTRGSTKVIKQPYCLSTLLYTLNNRCYMPIQFLLTDIQWCAWVGQVNWSRFSTGWVHFFRHPQKNCYIGCGRAPEQRYYE